MQKYILITGVSTGIGYDAVRHFTSKGYHVFGSVRSDFDYKRLNSDFVENFTPLQFDITNIKAIEKAREQVKLVLGNENLRALINNAGFAQGGPLALLSEQTFRQQIEVNLFGVRNVINTFLPQLGTSKELTRPPGKIINISSISGIFNTPMNGAYCVAKHALESLSEVYRRELMLYGIQVCSIQPGPIQSDLWNKNKDTLVKYFHTDYGKMAKNANQIIQQAQKRALSPEVVSRLIEKIINAKKPKLSYVITPNKLTNIFIAKYLPRRLADYFLFKSLHR